jgi:hypothetical protein
MRAWFSMAPPPSLLDGARVIRFAIIDERVEPTGQTIHRVGDQVAGPAAALVVCQYDGECDFYLFYCDAEWNVVTDTWHETMESALNQAAFEYRGILFS